MYYPSSQPFTIGISEWHQTWYHLYLVTNSHVAGPWFCTLLTLTTSHWYNHIMKLTLDSSLTTLPLLNNFL
jgi:hypothetical protein